MQEMNSMTRKQVDTSDWAIIIEKKDLGILITCIRKKPMFKLYLELYHVPQNMIILFETLEDLWGFLRDSDRYAIEGNTLKVGFTFKLRQKEISFHMDGNQTELIETISRLQEEVRVKSLNFQQQILQLKEDNLRKVLVIKDLKQKVAHQQFWKRKYEESQRPISVFAQFFSFNKSQIDRKTQLFNSPCLEKDIFQIEKNKKIELIDNSNGNKGIFSSFDRQNIPQLQQEQRPFEIRENGKQEQKKEKMSLHIQKMEQKEEQLLNLVEEMRQLGISSRNKKASQHHFMKKKRQIRIQ